MRKLDTILIIAVAIAISSPAMAKDVRSSSNSSLIKHSVTGSHIKQGQISVKTKPTSSTLKLDGIQGEAKDQQRH